MRERLAIGDEVAPHYIAAEQAILRILMLAATELDAVAGLAATHLDPQLRGCVLRKAIQHYALGRLLHLSRCFALERLDARKGHCLQFAGRGCRQTRSLPGAILKPHAVPTRLQRSYVEVLTGIDVGKHDWAIGGAPGVIGADAAGIVSGWLEANLGAQQERLLSVSLGAVLVRSEEGRVG